MKMIKELLEDNPIFTGLDPEYIDFIAGCASNRQFKEGELIFREGGDADFFYVICEGKVALDIYVSHRGELTVETIGEGDVLSFSWLFPPHRWVFDARALEPVRTIAFDGRSLRAKCEDDPRLGYELMKRFTGIILKRLDATRTRWIDMYGKPGTNLE